MIYMIIWSRIVEGKERKEKYSFSFYHTINENNQSVLGMKRSELIFKNNQWLINPENNDQNKVVYDKDIARQYKVILH